MTARISSRLIAIRAGAFLGIIAAKNSNQPVALEFLELQWADARRMIRTTM